MDDHTFRNAMGKFTTGVTVVATKTEDDIYGMTANAFMSVSLNPKLITVSIDNRANMLERIKLSNTFSVNILSEEQQDISMHFAGQTNEDKDIDFKLVKDIPILEDSLVSVVCHVYDSYVVGDHTLFIGEVIDIKLNEGNPLTFYSGQYGIKKASYCIK